MTLRGAGLAGTLTSAVLAGSAYLTAMVGVDAPRLAPSLMLGAIAVCCASTPLLAARRGEHHRVLIVASVASLLLVAGVFGAALLLPPETVDGPAILGLPRRLALVVYGVGLLPFLFLPLAFAIDFRTDDLSPEALAQLRNDCVALREQRR